VLHCVNRTSKDLSRTESQGQGQGLTLLVIFVVAAADAIVAHAAAAIKVRTGISAFITDKQCRSTVNDDGGSGQ